MAYTQAGRPLSVKTALGTDAVLLTGLRGREAISQLFEFELDLMAPLEKPADFSKILGQPAAVELKLPGNKKRHFHGIVNRFSQGRRDQVFAYYRATVVPQFWLLTKRVQSRIFQQITVPDILKKVLEGLKVTWELKGTYEPRDYCVQYRESDFAFASRTMEEEGIYYFFKHSANGHEMVVADTPGSHVDVPVAATLKFDEIRGGNRPEDRVIEWERAQELRSGKVTLWDHCFELPHQKLDAEKKLPDSVKMGKVTHTVALSGTEKLELYDWPGGYAARFDGIAPGGGDRAGDLDKIAQDNKRTAGIRLEQEAVEAVTARGASTIGQLTAGHKFKLTEHYDADGDYVLTEVAHAASLGPDYRSGAGETLVYENQFRSIPLAVPFRPALRTPRPTIHGTQSAVVVGPKGEEIFTDKYSRVKVQFHWDREGKNDENSSCWVRVVTNWAGKQWGMIHIPRIGQEVVVAFHEGDPDQPVIVGSVYNAEQMPPFALPGNKTQSGVQTRSSLGGAGANHNQIRFEDKAGAEQLHIHAEKNQDIEVENDETHWVGHDRKKTIDHDETTLVKHDRTETVNHDETIVIDHDRTETVHNNETITIDGNRKETVHKDESIEIDGNRTETVHKDEKISIDGNRTEAVGKDESISIHGNRTEKVTKDEKISIGGGRTESVSKDEKIDISGGRTETVGKNESISVTGGRTASVGKSQSVTVKENDTLDVGKVLLITAGESITLRTGSASISMKKDGTIVIEGKDITIVGSGEIVGKATKTMTLKGKKILQN